MNGFDLLYGNRTLKNNMQKKSGAPHAILLEGKEGSGKKTAALLAACFFECESENAPCLKCTACKKVLEHGAPDIRYIAPESGKKYISVDAIRAVRTSALVSPIELSRTVFIIENAEKMNAAAQNAFLKILEEPPEHVKFILTTDSAFSLLPTVISRCSLFRTELFSGDKDSFTAWYEGALSAFPRDIISKVWGISTVKISSMKKAIAEKEIAPGSIGEVFSGLLSEKKKTDPLCDEFIEAIAKPGYTTVLSLKKKLPKKREDYSDFIANLSRAVRDIAAVKKAQNAHLLYFQDKNDCLSFARSIPLGTLISILTSLKEAAKEIAGNCNVSLSQTKLLINTYSAKNRKV